MDANDESRFGMRKGSMLRIEDGLDQLIQVWEGGLWLTQENDRRDRYLGPGDWFRLDRDGLAIAHAVKPTILSVSAPIRERPGFWARLFAPYAQPTTAAL